jgi:hypothetical protein
VRTANLALKFGLELAALAAFAYCGNQLHGALRSVLVAVVAPLGVACLWGLLAAPSSSRRLAKAARIPFELAVFGLAALALWSAKLPVAAAVFAGVAALNSLLLTAFDQWES